MPAAVEKAQAVLSQWFTSLRLLQTDARALRFTAQGGRADVEVQLEVLQPMMAAEARQRELFYLEAFAAARLTHPNIARSSKPQQVEGLHFRVTEYKPEAARLRDLLSRNGWLEMSAACDIADQIAGAMDYAHRLGVLHLQLSPDCVWVEPNGRTTVAGFGIERASQLAWAHGERARRLNAIYAGIEHASGAACDERSDLYSLGAMLYEMLTDRVPFDSDDADYVRERQLQYTPAPPHLIATELPEAISEVIMKLLEREQENRFASAAEFKVALDAARQAGKG
ncbi:MAG TPA: serine/threonine-protein kinase [Blastocatellia bacterium]|nr:serine/threonine-protein kinase [Blastocatellia bacterium]